MMMRWLWMGMGTGESHLSNQVGRPTIWQNIVWMNMMTMSMTKVRVRSWPTLCSLFFRRIPIFDFEFFL